MKESSLVEPAAPCQRAARGSQTATQRRSYNPLIWLNLVCLDAPLVAISWQWLFAHSFEISIAQGGTTALFLTAWLIYLADRFGDSLSVDERMPLSLRQRFCLRYRSVWLGAIAAIAIADLFVCLRLDPRTIYAGGCIGVFALLYLILNQTKPALWRVLPAKEVSIGFLFAAGTMVGLSRGLSISVLPGWFLFAGLCSLNCVCIAVWERELDIAQERVSIATVFPNAEGYLAGTLGVTALLSCSLAAAEPELAGVYGCIGACAALLAVVHFFKAVIRPDVRTALADLVLLTPLVILWLRAAG